MDNAMEVWQFDKNIADRLAEYHAVFDNVDKNSSVVGYSSVWAAYLLNILQQHSWIGVWCPSHKECFEYHLHASINTNISVKKIDYDNLTASITVHPDELYSRIFSHDKLVEVPLKDLYVAKRQNNDEVDFKAIASCLDMFSIFYNYLIWPWDEDVDNCIVSFLPKLESRLTLYYDIVDGILNRAAQKDFFALVSRGKKIYELMRTSTPEFEESDDEAMSLSMNLYCNLKSIQNKVQRYEDPKMRNYINFVARMRKSCPGCHVILPEICDIANTIQIFGRMKKILPHAIYKGNSRSLNDVLMNYASDETIVISTGVHLVDSQQLDSNLTMWGLDEEQRPTIVDKTSYWYFLKTNGDNVLLRNLVINQQLCQAAIFVSEGVTEIDSVILNVKRSVKSVAIVVGCNASLLGSRCRFVGFDVAIFCLSGSAVELTDCVFENNGTCVEIMPGAQVCLIDCDLSMSKNGCVKYNGGINKNEFKSLDSLSDFDTISFRSVKVNEESKAVRFV